MLIKIPEKVIVKEFGWLSSLAGEGAVRAYILKHPEDVNEDLTIENLVALNVSFSKWKGKLREQWREIDLVFEKDKIYYLIETKRHGKYTKGLEQLGDLVDLFKIDFEKHKETYRGFIPVLVTTTDKIDEIESKWI